MSASIGQTLVQKIDDSREKAIAFLQQMVAIPSVTGDEAKIQKFLSDYMVKLGLNVDMWETDWEELKKHPAYRPVDRGYEGRPNIVDLIKTGKINLVFNTPLGRESFYDEKSIRRAAIRYNIPCITTLSAAQAAVRGIHAVIELKREVACLQDLHQNRAAASSNPGSRD